MTDLFERAGSLRPAYAAVDWGSTALGPTDGWSPALRNAIALMLGTRFAVTLLWGPERVMLYNAAYAELIVDKHPEALGRPALDVFPEAWSIIDPMLTGVETTGEATWVQDELIPLERSGYLEECYFTFSYSPVHGAGGAVEGTMDIAAETTGQVLADRRLRVLTVLGQALGEVDDLEQLRATAERVLVMPDLPAVQLRLGGQGPAPAYVDLEKELSVSDDGTEAWLPLPVSGPVRDAGLLIELNPQRALDRDYRSFLLLVAASLARITDRIVTTAAERSLSTALQLSLLSEPVRSLGVEVAVRYQPAVEVAQIGGDWYDAFRLPDGTLVFVVGDVAGHDQDAAATMAQLRNLTRGVAHAGADSPAAILGTVDKALENLEMAAVATAVVVQLDESQRRVRWSSAGHLPPVLVAPDGTVTLLDARPDVLLGADPSIGRQDHTVDLEPGATLVLYTDGLVERRGVPLQESLAWLADALAGTPRRTPDEICDDLLARTAGAVEDDVALLVLRLRD